MKKNTATIKTKIEGLLIITNNPFLLEKLEENGQIFPHGLDLFFCSVNFSEIHPLLNKNYKIIIVLDKHALDAELLRIEGNALRKQKYHIATLKTNSAIGDRECWDEIRKRMIRSTVK